MLIEKGDGTFVGGPLDVVCLLHDQTTGKYHAAFFEEKPFPGPIKPPEKTNPVRLMSKMHHTEGSDDLKVALGHLQELSVKIEVPPENLWIDPYPWNGKQGVVWVIENWKG